MVVASPRANLARLRRLIDDADRQLLELLIRRYGLAGEVAALKRGAGVERYIPWRELQILRRIETLNAGRLPQAVLAGIFRDILGLCRQSREPLTVTFPGPAGSLAHAAATAQFGFATRLEPAAGLADVFERVTQQRAHYGVVPLETASEGLGARALEYFLESDLTITAEHFWKLMLVVAGSRVRGHPRRLHVPEAVYALSRPWLRETFPRASMATGPSVAWAAQAAAAEPGSAAVCPELTAEVHGLQVVRRAPGPALAPELRFLTAGRSMPEVTRADKTTIAFSLADRVGILEETLGLFRRHRINLTFFESYYPSRTLPTATFFADFIGHSTEAGIQRVLGDLRRLTSFVKVLGSYPVFATGQTGPSYPYSSGVSPVKAEIQES
ncbi:MAG: chorismate mutase [Candidatus Riflebacteria bacterium]|nr:chorismate mutase [Candidatus Riflebacteria bacterium]